jgi:malate dehydrogenase (oxaloacetate-decarboxylating)
VLDSQGLLVASRPSRDTYKAELAWPTALAREVGVEQQGLSIADYVRKLRPTALVGTTGQPRIFDELVVRAMVEGCELPVIFPLSNPTSTSEADPADVVRWAQGRVLVATGSPFPDVRHDGRLHRVAQGNNVWIFPGVGKGAIVSGARTVSEGMFLGAAHALADSLTDHELSELALYPRLTRLREVTANVALRVAHIAVAEGLAPPATDDALRERIAADTWEPRYAKLVAEG